MCMMTPTARHAQRLFAEYLANPPRRPRVVARAIRRTTAAAARNAARGVA
jgi:hypothetical protein